MTDFTMVKRRCRLVTTMISGGRKLLGSLSKFVGKVDISPYSQKAEDRSTGGSISRYSVCGEVNRGSCFVSCNRLSYILLLQWPRRSLQQSGDMEGKGQSRRHLKRPKHLCDLLRLHVDTIPPRHK